jgi:hypothetical protein
MIKIVIFLSLFLSSCILEQRHTLIYPHEVEEILFKYIDEAYMHGNAVNDELLSKGIIEFQPHEQFTAFVVGTCMVWSNNNWDVTINKNYWDSIGYASRELLLFHELGHCLHHFPHRNGKLNDGMPASVMYPSMFSSDYYYSFIDYYMEELFET